MSDDFYCDQVLTGKVHIRTVAETDNVLAFHHTNPSWPVHIIVIPKKHVLTLLDVIDEDNKILLEMMMVIKKIVQQIWNEYGECRLTTNFGNCQNSKHLHWHIYVGDMMC